MLVSAGEQDRALYLLTEGTVGVRLHVPATVIKAHCAPYLERGKPARLSAPIATSTLSSGNDRSLPRNVLVSTLWNRARMMPLHKNKAPLANPWPKI